MKNKFYIFIILFPFMLLGNADETKEKIYIKNIDQVAAKENKILVIEFWAPSCIPCIRLKRDIFDNSTNIAFLEKHFQIIKFSPADSVYDSLWKYFKLSYQSSIIYINKRGNEIERTVSYDGDKDAYLNFMKDVSQGSNLYQDLLRDYRMNRLNTYRTYLLARKLLYRYELKDALNLYNKILSQDSEDKLMLHAESKFKIAETELMLTGDLTKMQEYVKTSLRNPFKPKAYEYLINDLINKRDKAGCLGMCDKAFNEYPGSWEILNKYAWAICTFKITEEYRKALTMVQKSISLNPDRAGTYSTEAWIYFEMGNKERAIQCQKRAIEILPNVGFEKDLETFMKK